jgi:protein SCO1/2
LFGYTHCPELCPTALFDLTRHLATLGAEADRLGVVFVTVDPERDTPEVLREYLASFDPRITGVTGTVDQIKGVATAFGTRFERRGARSDYSMDHPYMLFLVDRYGLLARAVGYDDPKGLASYSKRVLAQ